MVLLNLHWAPVYCLLLLLWMSCKFDIHWAIRLARGSKWSGEGREYPKTNRDLGILGFLASSSVKWKLFVNGMNLQDFIFPGTEESWHDRSMSVLSSGLWPKPLQKQVENMVLSFTVDASFVGKRHKLCLSYLLNTETIVWNQNS